ncbi:hypothetical protein [Chromatium okenii]|jgi:hypothetical protein|uniref:Uncharacterized protein n=1 Tax=Chromatium okenii TaxID=61644 RepID=A0A2S7XQ23_9GAMM|nr:hypothetical protein [Chromatium okenii]MBV5308393.1 hypothetical protein [Chromatium okenii]PQJ95839.1 hypothetical protein CXB77_11680 [Chromatium okenii]PQJ96370.1 hypothetical protein CXB77_11630 [Chromatium okenii]
MSAKLNVTESWVDPDDAPELTDDFFETGIWKIGERDVSRAEGEAMMRQTYCTEINPLNDILRD